MPHTDPDAAKLDAAVLARQTLAAHLFDTMARDTAESGGPGVTRESYSAAETLAHDLIAKTGAELGLEVEQDFAANTYVTLAGTDRDAAPIVIGSHLDSVQNGGNFDGYAGVVAGMVALAAMTDSGWRPTRDICVMGIRAVQAGALTDAQERRGQDRSGQERSHSGQERSGQEKSEL